MSATTGGTLSMTTPTISNSSSISGGGSGHHRTHSRNISIGGLGKNVAKINDYNFSYLVKSSSAKQSSSTTSTNSNNNRSKTIVTPHRGPIDKTTKHLLELYKGCNPGFSYVSSLNPRRVLTHPSEGVLNDGFDNVNSDYIIYVNDIIGSDFNQRYKVLDTLGQGTFGQVVKCQNCDTNELVAVKILKNKSAYYQQGRLEIDILKKLNVNYDPDNKANILRLLDSFVFKKHLCIVFELLSVNLFELIKQNSFRGLSTNLIKVFLIQILDALIVLSKANMIHCDLKPENILLQSVNSPNIKLIDFGSACYENQTIYSYIQSRHYRSPEVLIGVQYTSSIDMWSLGCISAELFLGLPLFPGTSEYNQICRIIDMRGMFSNEMIERGKNSANYFKQTIENGKIAYKLKSDEEYQRETNKVLEPQKKYFNYTLLTDIIQNYGFKKNLAPQEIEKEKLNRIVFTDFVSGLLNLDPLERWSPMQARDHPFITGSPYNGPFVPDPAKKNPFVGSSAAKPIMLNTAGAATASQNHSFSSNNSFSKRVPVLPQFKHSLGGEPAYFPESYSPRSLYGSFSNGNNSHQSSQLALGQSPSMFGTPSMFPPVPFSPHYGSTPYYGSWGGSDGLPPPPLNSAIYQQQQQNSRRGRSKSDAPNSNGNDLLPNNGNNGMPIMLDDQYGLDGDKPPMYPLNSPQRKRSQSGLVPMDNPYHQFIPRMHLDHWSSSNRYRSHSYGEQHNQHPSNKQLQQSPLQQSAPQIFEYSRIQMQQQQQRHHHNQQYSPPIPNSPQISLPLTPQLISQDPNSPLMGSDTGMNWNPSPSEEMLFPIEQLLPSQQTPQLTSQQQQQSTNPLSKSTSSPVGSRFIPPQLQNSWKMDDINSNFNSMQINGEQGASWQPPTSPWGIPQFSIQNESPYDNDPHSNMISYSPYTMVFQSPPSNYNNYSIKQSPPTRSFYNDMQSNSHGAYSTNNYSAGGSSNHPHSYSAPSKYNPQQQQVQQQQVQQQQMNQQSPPSSNFNNLVANNNGHQVGNKPIKNRPRNDAFSRTSPPTSRAHPQQQQVQQQYQQSASKPISLSQTFSQPYQSPSTPLSPNTPPFIPQQYINHPPLPTSMLPLQTPTNKQANYNLPQHNSNPLSKSKELVNENDESKQSIHNQEANSGQNINRKLLIGSYRDPVASSPPP